MKTRMSVARKMTIICAIFVAVPLVLMTVIVGVKGRDMIRETAVGHMESVTGDILRICAVQEELVQKKLASDARLLQELFVKGGSRIPELGTDFSVVDHVNTITGSLSTIFRFEGDGMTRVSTNVRKADGSRAIGTRIMPDSPVYQAVKAGTVYRGKAEVVGNWCLTEYQPVVSGGQVVGVLFVGVKMSDSLSLKKSVDETRIARTGIIYILDGNGKVVVHPTLKAGEDLSGGAVVQEMLKEKKGRLVRNIDGKSVMMNFTHFDAWDWVVVAQAPTDEIYAGVNALLKVLGISLVLLMAGGVAGVFVLSSREMKGVTDSVGGLSEASELIGSASAMLSATSQRLAEGSSRQASSIEETASALEEMGAMTRRNTESAGEAKSLSDRAGRSVEKADASMNRLVGQMSEISSMGEEIGKIIKTIDEIAFQTNLLALNAAVEAARAGEAGAGFAVVADEVRNLAQRAAGAAKNTSELIEGAIKKIKDGTALVEKTNADFSEVTSSVKKVAELVAEVSAASSEQARGIVEVGGSVSQMDKVTQANAASAEEIASASEEMNAQALTLQGIVGGLQTLVGGAEAAKPAAHEAPSKPSGPSRRIAASTGRTAPALSPASVPAAKERGNGKSLGAIRLNAEEEIPLEKH